MIVLSVDMQSFEVQASEESICRVFEFLQRRKCCVALLEAFEKESIVQVSGRLQSRFVLVAIQQIALYEALHHWVLSDLFSVRRKH